MIGLAKLAPGEGNVDLAERPERPPGPGEVALDVHAAGVCGTDLHIWLGEYDSVPPVTMGHEVCGTVAELGEGVDDSWLGARVAVETFFSTCGTCDYCRAGRLSVCAAAALDRHPRRRWVRATAGDPGRATCTECPRRCRTPPRRSRSRSPACATR